MYCRVKGYVLQHKNVGVTKNLFFIFVAFTFNG